MVDVENIFRRLRENRAAGNPRSVFEVVVAASNEVRSGIVYATAIIVLVFVPLFALSGIEGRLFAPLGQAYIVSILASLVVSITLTPVLASWLLPGLKSLEEHESRFIRGLKRLNAAALRVVFRHQRLLVGTVVALVVGAGIAASQLPRAFLPPFNEGSFTVTMAFTPGISLTESSRVGAIAERLLMEIPEVAAVGRRTGRAELDEHAEGVHSSDLEVALKGAAGRRPNWWPRSAGGSPSCRSRSMSASRSRTGSTTCCPASGPRSPSRSSARTWMRCGARRPRSRSGCGRSPASPTSRSRSRPGSRSWRSGSITAGLALYGVQPAAVVEQISRLSNGRLVSTVVDGYRRFDVVLRLPEAQRTTAGLGDLLIETPSGWVPARQIADIRETDGPNQILRENGRRRLVVMANTVPGSDMAAIVAAIRKVVAAETLPPGAFASLEGTFQAQEEASRTIGALSLVSLGLIFALLTSRYRSGGWR